MYDDDKCDAEVVGYQGLSDRLRAEGATDEDIASAHAARLASGAEWCGWHGYCTRDLDLLRSFLPAAEAEPETPEPPLWQTGVVLALTGGGGSRAVCDMCGDTVAADGLMGYRPDPLDTIETTAYALLGAMARHEQDAHGIDHKGRKPTKGELRREVERLRFAAESLVADRDAQQARAESTGAERDEANARAERLKTERDEAVVDRDRARASRNAAQADRDQWRERAESAGAIIDKAQDERAAARQRADKAEAEVERLSDERDFWKSTAEAEVARLTALCDELTEAKEDAQRRATRNASEAEDAYERASVLAGVGIDLLRLLGGDA